MLIIHPRSVAPHKDVWTQEEIDRLKALHAKGRTQNQMAVQLRRSRYAVQKKMARLGLLPTAKGSLNAVTKERARIAAALRIKADVEEGHIWYHPATNLRALANHVEQGKL